MKKLKHNSLPYHIVGGRQEIIEAILCWDVGGGQHCCTGDFEVCWCQ